MMGRRAMMGAAAAAKKYRYFSIDITANNGHVSRLALDELELFVGAVEYPTANMTGNSAPSPLVASATTEDTGRSAWEAFDGIGIEGLGWLTVNGNTTGRLSIDLGAGNEIAITGTSKNSPFSGVVDLESG